MMTRRKVEIIAFHRERIVKQPVMCCPVCQRDGELLTARQASVLTKVKPKTIYRWLAEGKAHGIRTAGGGHRICRHSLFYQVGWSPA